VLANLNFLASVLPATRPILSRASRYRRLDDMSRSVCAIVAMVALCSCARTDDGTVEPKYVMTVSRQGWIPRMSIRKNRELQPVEPTVEFLPSPPLEAPQERVKPKTRRKAKKPVTEATKQPDKPEPPRSFLCNRTHSTDGRTRVVCQ
jgi:hypothetical protein